MTATATAPAERTSFFDEQARRRRGARRLGLVCLVLAAGVGAVLSTLLGPLILLAVAGALRLLAALGVAPGIMSAGLRVVEVWVREGIAALSRGADLVGAAATLQQGLATLPLFGRAALLLLPGMVAAMLLWACLARFHRNTAAAAAAAGLAAREPRTTDPEERQIGNIVVEIALAAGLPAPRLLLVDAPTVNTAVFGASHQAATVIVTRGLLDQLDRRETQGLVAHLVASAGNGDLRLAASVQAVFVTLGALLTLFDLPFRRSAWTALGGLFYAAAGRVSGAEAEAISTSLTTSLTPDSSEAMLQVMSLVERWPPLGAFLVAPLLPWMLLTTLQKFIVQMWMLFLFGWPLALLWRVRRYLADAVAVQLTRDPDALAGALGRINGQAGLPPGGAAHELGFVHTPQASQTKLRERMMVAMPLTPPIGKRLRRLSSLGATGLRFASAFAGLRALPPLKLALVLMLLALLVPLVGMLVVLVSGLLVGATALSIAGGLALTSLILRL